MALSITPKYSINPEGLYFNRYRTVTPPIIPQGTKVPSNQTLGLRMSTIFNNIPTGERRSLGRYFTNDKKHSQLLGPKTTSCDEEKILPELRATLGLLLQTLENLGIDRGTILIPKEERHKSGITQDLALFLELTENTVDEIFDFWSEPTHSFLLKYIDALPFEDSDPAPLSRPFRTKDCRRWGWYRSKSRTVGKNPFIT